jgi:uncharacterized protein involved in exopolysaccharide biosynthesis
MEPPASVEGEEKGGVDLLDIALVLARQWRRIALVTIAATVIGITYSLLLKPTFTATASILPPSSSSRQPGRWPVSLDRCWAAAGLASD